MRESSKTGGLRELLWLAAPLAASQAGNHLINLVDTAILGRFSEVAQGAAGLANNLFFAFSVVGLGVMMSLDPLVSQAVGANEQGRARTLLWQGIWLSLFIGALLAVPIALSPFFLGLFQIEEETKEAATLFMWVRLVGVWPLLLFSGLRNYLQAMGKTSPMIIATVVGNVTNFLFANLFVFGGSATEVYLFGEELGYLTFIPGLGIAGAALTATLCGVIQVSVLLLAVRSTDTKEAYSRRPVPAEIKKALRVGIPIGLQLMAEVGAFSLAGLIAGYFGKVPLAAHQIALTWASFTFSMALGISSAGAVLVGRAIGAQDKAATRRAGLLSFGLVVCAMSLPALLFGFFPRTLAALLSNSEAVIQATIPLFWVAAVFQVFDGVQVTGAGVLRGAGDTKTTFSANVAGHYLVGLPIGLLLGVWMGVGVVGLWWGLCAGLVSVGLLLFWRFWRLSARPIARL